MKSITSLIRENTNLRAKLRDVAAKAAAELKRSQRLHADVEAMRAEHAKNVALVERIREWAVANGFEAPELE